MIVTTTRLKVASLNRRQLIQTILPLLRRVRDERGCLSSHLYEDVGDEGTSILVEEWETQAAWNNHLQTKECAIIMGAISVLCNPPNVEFKLLEYLAGMEALREFRTPHE